MGQALKFRRKTQRPSEDRRLDEETKERKKKQRPQAEWDAKTDNFREEKR